MTVRSAFGLSLLSFDATMCSMSEPHKLDSSQVKGREDVVIVVGVVGVSSVASRRFFTRARRRFFLTLFVQITLYSFSFYNSISYYSTIRRERVLLVRFLFHHHLLLLLLLAFPRSSLLSKRLAPLLPLKALLRRARRRRRAAV